MSLLIQFNFQRVRRNYDLSLNAVMNFPVSLRGITLTLTTIEFWKKTLV